MIRKGFDRKNKKEKDFSYVLTNDQIRETCDLPRISQFVGTLQTKFLEQIARADNSRCVKQLTFNVDKSIKRGWQNTLEKEVLKFNNMTEDNFYKMALSKEKN